MTTGSASFSASQTKGRSISRKMTGITPVQHFLLSATTQLKIICKPGHSCSLDEDAELRVM